GAWPALNATFEDESEELVFRDTCDIGLAVASDAGLVVPVIRDAGGLSFGALAEEIARITEAGRSGRLPPEDLRGATFTVSNVGVWGGRSATPIVRPPEVAIVGFGAVRARPLVVDDVVVAAPSLPISVSADHRVVDGHEATGFLEALIGLLRAPDLLAG